MEDLQQITIRTMRLFVAIVELGNFSEVARREGIAASSVSRVVQQLESALQTQLLYRNTRGGSADRSRAAICPLRPLDA
ncbi:transcriptional regulator [Serratia odorifera]|uniref:Transcriptional regulator n=1 Tax=Serratia odorifera TaxID=618 RepID=A0A3S4HW69_SEROD|nr:transcriptional regulator [Serratia odorifera]